MPRTLTSNQGRRARLISYLLVDRRVLAGLWRVFTPAGIAGAGRLHEALGDPTVRGRGGYERNVAISLPARRAAARLVGRHASQTGGARECWAAP
ncbi:MAG: hypothetical protein ACR2L9_05410 [Solirubrobacteraceae bacterium]